jgi:hypothetical protein
MNIINNRTGYRKAYTINCNGQPRTFTAADYPVGLSPDAYHFHVHLNGPDFFDAYYTSSNGRVG